MISSISLKSGDRVVLRKPHPCGGREWTVTRTGADIGLQCAACGRRVMLDREELERRIKTITPAPELQQDQAVC